MDDELKYAKDVKAELRLMFDVEFLVFAEICIISAAAQESFGNVFESVRTHDGIEERFSHELNSVQIAGVMDSLLRSISSGCENMHKSILDSLSELFTNSTRRETYIPKSSKK